MENIATLLSQLANLDYCYLTTIGRRSGNPHEIEIWFGVQGSLLYLLSGGREDSDWVKNLRANPNVTVRIAKQTFTGVARIVNEDKESTTVRHILARKYQSWKEGQSLSEWGKTALVVEIELNS